MTWNPAEHSDQDNLTWSWLRAVEWLNWPIFLSQAYAPLLLLQFNWKAVAATVLVLNYAWALIVRYHFVSIRAAYIGALFVRVKWIACPAAAVYLWFVHARSAAVLALLWPVVILIAPWVPAAGFLILIHGQIGRVQNMFMSKLGYERRT